MHHIDKETAKYIIDYFSELLPSHEKIAMEYMLSQFKPENRDKHTFMNKWATDIYKKNGWLTESQTVLDLLKEGYDSFERKTALKILKEHPNDIFLNKCPQCQRLARTPFAKQCKHCKFDWHH